MPTVTSPRDSTEKADSSNRVSTSPGVAPPENTDKATAELSIVVDELLNQLSAKFAGISEELISKMDDMSRRLDSLEASIHAGKGSPPEK